MPNLHTDSDVMLTDLSGHHSLFFVHTLFPQVF